MTATSDPRALPVISDVEIQRWEREIFERIGAEAPTAARERSVRPRVWIGVLGAAAAVVLAAVVLPPLTRDGLREQSAGSTAADSAPALPAAGSSEGDASEGAGGMREVVATATVSLEAEDPAAALDALTAAVARSAGYIERSVTSVEGADVPASNPDVNGGVAAGTYPSAPEGGASATVRVPAERLSDVIAEVGGLGTVTASTLSQDDVTDAAVDLRARVSIGEASVERLTDLMTAAASVSDIVDLEAALAERQATLESDRQQLASLESQVSLATLTVSISPSSAPTADPAGFGEGLATGWGALVAGANGTVVVIGFLLPWLALAAVALGVVWGVKRLRRRRPSPPQP